MIRTKCQKKSKWLQVKMAWKKNTESCVAVVRCLVELIRYEELHFLRGWPALSHHMLLYLFLGRLNPLCIMYASLFFPLPVRKSKLVQRRRYTCPSAQDISRALQNPGSAPSTSAVSLDELIQRCLNCFGQSLCCTVCHVPLLFITTRLYKWDEGGNGGLFGVRGTSGRVGGVGWGRQRPVSYNQALFCWAAEAS